MNISLGSRNSEGSPKSARRLQFVFPWESENTQQTKKQMKKRKNRSNQDLCRLGSIILFVFAGGSKSKINRTNRASRSNGVR